MTTTAADSSPAPNPTCARPTCQWCREPLRPFTTRHGLPRDSMVMTRAEAARHVNERITSCVRSEGWRWTDNGGREFIPASERRIIAVNLWDGETYRGYPSRGRTPLFCTLDCALAFAVASHRAGIRRKS